ncbi:FAD-dependent oxidoreductase [Burkholderia cenocepacia]|jgi:3-phenylpropionate/trans-cinnamate dioxygenase ferredoxin reductase subunit|uniref:NAD(P)/FAD-dependent oxidoreductase n=1 Tax=Burkholderia cenocepacia TaxID=95486 RepID=UPI0004F7018E|nr:FAD-dependent oxidoreductase [Burkholderia cenocepacia]AIO48922.1 pyridine nucleotide-disulfide oxidoreductase family protein [Burkholderia cepacia]KGB97223.1 pyridine nucleotide-disulfide oxidoreductase family protein [Burkholderia cepacia]MCG0578122.1 FAD-dependent oxidoreductase [Burkholderia cenocepacia]MCW3526345.1 FAD-dependent oxidoreductase [Burkholderia cenocepacia]MCW3616296.1 FAD-dependent oxidoreductase [Burkholderia cenocepacia]
MNSDRVMAIVGAGHAGGRAAQELRACGWRGRIVLIGAEPHPPYERPPLSKGVLTGERSAAQCRLRDAQAWAADRIERIVATVERIEPHACEVRVSGGHVFGYDALLLATGGRARRLAIPGAALDGVFALRTLDDAAALGARLVPDARIVLIGGGFIGLEVAASARQRGCRVTVLDAAPRLLGRAVPEAIATRVHALHDEQGVAIRLNRTPVAIERTAGRALAVVLDDGDTLIADTVVAGIGIEPADELARDAGLAVERGIVVNAQLETSARGIYAAGDVAVFPSALSGQLVRQETWHGAETQAHVAARNMLGAGEPYRDTPWFWSDQYDAQLQVAGEPALGTRSVARVLGDDAEIHFHFDARARLVAASGFGRAAGFVKDMRVARMLVERGTDVTPAAVADVDVKLKSLVTAVNDR